MGVYDILEDKNTNSYSKGQYNGLLQDFLQEEPEISSAFKEVFEHALEINKDLRIWANMPISVNQKTISNQIIRYKDAFKIPYGKLTVPAIIYWKTEDSQRAIVISDDNYIEAKGMYFAITEPETELVSFRNDMLAIVVNEDTLPEATKAFDEMLEGKRAVGAIQRYYDHHFFRTVDEMKEKCIEIAQKKFDEAVAVLPEIEERNPIIYDVIGKVFLLKKALYVQYMMTKDLLMDRHEGDVRKQRQFAKAYCDEIPIVSFSAMWRLQKEGTPSEETAEETAEEE